MLTLRNSHLRVEIDPAQGAEIRAVRTPDGRNALAWFDWESPTPVGRGASYGDPELDWLSGYRGGWQETVPNAGLACVVAGVPMGFHGDATRTRWTVVDAGEDWCHLRSSSRLPLVIDRHLRLAVDRPAVSLEGSVTNVGRTYVEFVWGQHPAFPSVAGGQIDLPAGCLVEHDRGRGGDLVQEPSAWPLARGVDGTEVDLSVQPADGTHRLLYLTGHSQGWAALRQPEPYVGVAMAWDVAVHPFIWLWTMRNIADFPWYGRASVLAIEAQASWPYDGLANAAARGQAIGLPVGETVSSWYTMALLPTGSPPVVGVSRDGVVLTEAGTGSR